jgi:hypothetical protein
MPLSERALSRTTSSRSRRWRWPAFGGVICVWSNTISPASVMKGTTIGGEGRRATTGICG